MKTIIFTTILIFLISSKMFAVTNYVSLTGNHISPFANWTDAATNIQDAIDIATNNNNIVLVNDGIYYPPNQINISNQTEKTSILFTSLNGAKKTIIDGNKSHRCLYLSTYDENIKVNGFTIRNGYTTGSYPYSYGGGIYIRGIYTIVENCIMISNSASVYGGGIAGGMDCYINNCTFIYNTAMEGGGVSYSRLLTNCIFVNNYASKGGGVSSSTLHNSYIANNNSEFGGGSHWSVLYNCQIISNTASRNGGGTFESRVYNSLITENSASVGGGIWCNSSFGADYVNCTIVKNVAESNGGVGGSGCKIKNSIIFNNIAQSNINYDSNSEILYSCTTPLHSGIGNLASNPEFVDFASGNYNLLQFSDCINSGSNAYVVGSKDLNGNPRIIDDIVDMGAYEYLPEPGCFWIIGLLGSWFIERKFKLYSSK